MSSKIVVEMSAQEANLVRSLNRLALSQDDLAKKIKELEKGYNDAGAAGERGASRVEKATNAAAKAKWEEERAIRKAKQSWEEQAKAAEESNKLATSAVSSITAMAGAYLSVQQAIALVNNELQKKRELQREAADVQISLEAAHTQITRNVAGPDVQRMLAAASRIATEQSVPEAEVARAIAQAYSASGGNAKATESAVYTAAGFLKSAPQDISRYAGSLLDVAAVTGTDDAVMNQGLLSGVGRMSRVVDAGMQARNIPQALVGMGSYGANAGQAGALFAAMSTAIKDQEGAVSATAGIQLAKQLAEFLPASGMAEQVKGGLSESDTLAREANQKALAKARSRQAQGLKLNDADIAAIRAEEGFAERAASRKVIGARPGLSDFGSRVAFLQANPEMAKAFLGEASFETKAAGSISEFLTNKDSELARLYGQNLAAFPSAEQMRAGGQASIFAQTQTPYFATAEAERIFKRGEEELGLSGPGMAAVTREGLTRLLAKSGMTDLGTRMESMAFDWNTSMGQVGALEYASREVRQQQARLANPVEARMTASGDPMAGAGNVELVPRPPTVSEQAMAESLKVVADKLDSLIQVTKQGQEKARPPALANPDVDK